MVKPEEKYTKDEIHQLIHALFLEKKQSKALLTELKQLEQTNKNKSSQDLIECKTHAAQLERAIKYLHSKIDELNSECEYLNAEVQKQTKQLNDKSRIIENKLNENEEITQELYALTSQFNTLKEKIVDLSSKNSDLENLLKNYNNANKSLAASLEERISKQEEASGHVTDH